MVLSVKVIRTVCVFTGECVYLNYLSVEHLQLVHFSVGMTLPISTNSVFVKKSIDLQY